MSLSFPIAGPVGPMPKRMADIIHDDDDFREAYRLHMAGHVEASVAFYKKSLSGHPSAEAHTCLGWAYAMLGRLDDAIDACREAVKLDPEFGNGWNDLGAYLLERNELGAAEFYLRRATEADQYATRELAWFNLARLKLRQGRAPEAVALLHRAQSENAEHVPTKLLLNELTGRMSAEAKGFVPRLDG